MHITAKWLCLFLQRPRCAEASLHRCANCEFDCFVRLVALLFVGRVSPMVQVLMLQVRSIFPGDWHAGQIKAPCDPQQMTTRVGHVPSIFASRTGCGTRAAASQRLFGGVQCSANCFFNCRCSGSTAWCTIDQTKRFLLVQNAIAFTLLRQFLFRGVKASGPQCRL